MKNLNSLVILFVAACATPKEIPRVKANFYMKFHDGEVGRSVLKSDGQREVTVGDTPEEKQKLLDEWTNLTDHIAIPTEDYQRLVNRQNL